jgi:hypothetical protein
MNYWEGLVWAFTFMCSEVFIKHFGFILKNLSSHVHLEDGLYGINWTSGAVRGIQKISKLYLKIKQNFKHITAENLT